jgi:hypothetical protein
MLHLKTLKADSGIRILDSGRRWGEDFCILQGTEIRTGCHGNTDQKGHDYSAFRRFDCVLHELEMLWGKQKA